MNSTEISKEIELLNNQLSNLSGIEQPSVKTAAEAIAQAEVIAQAEAKEKVLVTALEQLESQLGKALRAEDMARQSDNLAKCKAFEVEAAQRLNEAAQKFAEGKEILREFHKWEKKHFQLFLETYGTPQSPSRLRLGSNDWDGLLIPKSFNLAQESNFGMQTMPLDIFGKFN